MLIYYFFVFSFNKTETPNEFSLKDTFIKSKSFGESSTNPNWSGESEPKSTTDSILSKKSSFSSIDVSKIKDQMQTGIIKFFFQ